MSHAETNIHMFPLENFSHGDVTIASEGQQILTYTRHLQALSSEVFLACHTQL